MKSDCVSIKSAENFENIGWSSVRLLLCAGYAGLPGKPLGLSCMEEMRSGGGECGNLLEKE